MNILVTGGAGFLGRAFVRHHQEQGNEVLAIDNLSSPYARFPKGIHRLVIDLMSIPRWVQKEKFDRIYHFAAPVGGREKIEGDPMYNAESLAIDSFLFRWVSSMDEKPTVLYPSSSAVYPVCLQGVNDGRRLREDEADLSSSVWSRPDEMYGFTKFAGEMLAIKAAQYGVRTVCIRPFSGYGEEQSLEYPFPSIMQRFIDKDDEIAVWGDGSQMRDFIHVDDIVGATEAILGAPTANYEPVNIASGVGVSFIQLITRTMREVGYEVPIRMMMDKPVGVRYRVGDPSLMLQYYTPKVGLDEGIRRVLRYRESGGHA